jgi:hypothetical protein
MSGSSNNRLKFLDDEHGEHGEHVRLCGPGSRTYMANLLSNRGSHVRANVRRLGPAAGASHGETNDHPINHRPHTVGSFLEVPR